MRQTFLGIVAWLLYRALACTWRITWYEPACMREALRQRRPFIMAHWHGDELALLHAVKRYRLATLASPSKDGRIMATLLRLLGARVSVGSGSSEKGATSLARPKSSTLSRSPPSARRCRNTLPGFTSR